MRRSPRAVIQGPASAAVSVTQLVASFTGGDTQQDTFASISSTVTVTGGSAPYTYATALIDPRGVDRAALLSGSTTATPSFTPDITGGSGVWVLRSTVTDSDSRETIATKAIVVGQTTTAGPNWVQTYSYVSDGSEASNPSAGTLLFGGLTWTIVNADAVSGPKVDGGNLSITPAPSTTLSGSAFSAAGLRIPLSTLTGLSTIGTRRLLICAELEDYTPTRSEEGFVFGLDVSGGGIGSGASGRGYGAGQVFSGATIRAARIIGQIGQSSILRGIPSTASATPCRSFAVIFSQAGAIAYSSTTASALDTATEVIAATSAMAGGCDAPSSFVALNQVIIAIQNPSAGANGVEFRLKELRVFVC